MKLSSVCMWVMVAIAAGSAAHAAPRKKELNNKAAYETADAMKGQAHITAAIQTPMIDLLRQADTINAEAMLRYGIALDLGRDSVSSQLTAGEKDKLKAGFRAMLDLYLTSKDSFDIEFNEDAMLDESEFWIYLAKHVGRRNPQQLNQTMGVPADTSTGGGGFFVPQNFQEEDAFNLNQDLVLKPGVVNAATTCAQSAYGFARMKKAQLVDISETKLTPEQFAKVQETAVNTYRMSYSQGILACGTKPFFLQTVDFASQNLGKLGTMKESPAAILATLSDPELAED